MRTPDGHLAFVYKTAAEIGELGDNTARLRAQIRDDDLLHLALRADTAQASVLAHTRWASIGIISEANAHPLNQEEVDGDGRVDSSSAYTVAALNGDVDNYADLKALDGLHFPAEITTDAKVIPALVARRTGAGVDLVEAFRSTVASFEGSVAIALQSAADPDCLLLAQRGSGQALYVGLAPDMFVVASEPYGVVAECGSYLRLDGETMVDPGNPASQGQVVVLDRRRAGTLGGCAPDLLRRARAPGRRGRPARAADHHPRRRPRRRAALPAEGDHRGAGVVPQDAARPRSSSATACSTCGCRRRRCPRGCSTRCGRERSGGCS